VKIQINGQSAGKIAFKTIIKKMIINNNNIDKLFSLKNNSKLFSVDSHKFKFFLAGFIEGEGSLCVSVKKHESSRFGYFIYPEFFFYQHVSGKPILDRSKELFRSGNVFLKSGSEDVYVYSITSRKVILEKVIPYFKRYVLPYSCKFTFFSTFLYIVESLENKKHYKLDGFLELLELTYSLNPNSKGKCRKIEFEVL
jgi:hypothetical protein